MRDDYDDALKKNKIQKNESRIHCEFFMKRDLPTNWGAYGIGPTTHGSRRLRAAAHIKVTSQGACGGIR